MGLRLSWKKMEFGSQIHWIGTTISIVDRRRVKVELTETFCDKVKKANQEIMKAEDATVKTIIAHAGSVGWAAGIAPVLAGHVAGLWAAAGLVRRLYAKTREAQRAKLRFEKKKIKYSPDALDVFQAFTCLHRRSHCKRSQLYFRVVSKRFFHHKYMPAGGVKCLQEE